MASVTCPECNHRFRLPPAARSGDDLTCPECEAAFVVGEIPAVPRTRSPEREPAYEPEEEEERPRGRRTGRRQRSESRMAGSRRGMRNVALGFKLVFYGTVLLLLAMLLAMVGSILLGGAVAAGARVGLAGLGLAGLLLMATNLLAVGGGVLLLIGECLCLAVPAEIERAKTFIVICVGLLIAAAVLMLVGVMGADLGRGGQYASGLGGLLGFASGVVFLLFARALAEYLDRPDLADLASAILVLVLILIGLCVVMYVVLFGAVLLGLGGGGAGGLLGGACVAGIVGLIYFVLSIIAAIKFAQLSRDMSEACERFAGRE